MDPGGSLSCWQCSSSYCCYQPVHFTRVAGCHLHCFAETSSVVSRKAVSLQIINNSSGMISQRHSAIADMKSSSCGYPGIPWKFGDRSWKICKSHNSTRISQEFKDSINQGIQFLRFELDLSRSPRREFSFYFQERFKTREPYDSKNKSTFSRNREIRKRRNSGGTENLPGNAKDQNLIFSV